MKMRKKISYEDIVEIGKSLIMEQTDVVWEEDDKERAVSACIVSGIISFLDRLDKATRMTEKEINEASDEFMRNLSANLSVNSEVLNKYNDKNNCGRE